MSASRRDGHGREATILLFVTHTKKVFFSTSCSGAVFSTRKSSTPISTQKQVAFPFVSELAKRDRFLVPQPLSPLPHTVLKIFPPKPQASLPPPHRSIQSYPHTPLPREIRGNTPPLTPPQTLVILDRVSPLDHKKPVKISPPFLLSPFVTSQAKKIPSILAPPSLHLSSPCLTTNSSDASTLPLNLDMTIDSLSLPKSRRPENQNCPSLHLPLQTSLSTVRNGGCFQTPRDVCPILTKSWQSLSVVQGCPPFRTSCSHLSPPRPKPL